MPGAVLHCCGILCEDIRDLYVISAGSRLQSLLKERMSLPVVE